MSEFLTTTPVVVSRIQHRRGTQDQFNALYPPGYTGVGGYDGPSTILQPGELAVCMDSRRVFVGALNGEYFEMGTGSGTGGGGSSECCGGLIAVSIPLQPSPDTYAPVPGVRFNPTPFHDIQYSATDATSPDVDAPGTMYTRSGKLTITSLKQSAASDLVNLVDYSVEVNKTVYDLVFRADYDGDGKSILVSYRHNFPMPLRMTTSSIVWISMGGF